ncbi:MAG TPA: hypothetical protein P5277_01585 [Candidatus Paceibacterota bacterium]|nr:hypothetical protein [Candidatus Paceibacterota bacterium]
MKRYEAISNLLKKEHRKTCPEKIKKRGFTQFCADKDQQNFYFENINLGYCSCLKTFSGRFFENVTAARVGGYIHNGSIMDISYSNGKIQPDVSDHKRRIYHEAKSIAAGQQLKIIREQFERFAQLQLLDVNPTPKIYFHFYRHNVQGMQRRKLSQEDLIEEIRKNIIYCVQTPFSVPLQFYLNPNKTRNNSDFLHNEYNYAESLPGRGFKSQHTTSISSDFLNELTINPEETLEKMGLNPENYTFKRKKVSGLKVNQKTISWFPLLVIEQKDYLSWLEQTRDKIKNDFLFMSELQDNNSLPLFNPNCDNPIGSGDYLPENTQDLESITERTVENIETVDSIQIPQEDADEEKEIPFC